MDGLAIGKFEDVCLRPVPLVYLFSGPQGALSLIPTTWLLAPSYHFPPFSLGNMGSHPTDRPVLVSFLSQICLYCSVCRGGSGQGNNQPRRKARGKAQPDVIHHHRLFLLLSPCPFPFVFPKRNRAVAMLFTDRDEIRLPAIACRQALLCVLCCVNLLTAFPPSTIGSKHRAKPFGLHMRLPRYAVCGPSTHPSLPLHPLQTTRGLPPKYAVRPDHSALPIHRVSG